MPDGSGKEIRQRPGWVLVYKDIEKYPPGGGVPQMPGDPPKTDTERDVITAWGQVIDDSSSLPLFGWACTWGKRPV